jgi:hypothetical protein
MKWKSNDILAILDACCENFTFPMLDNGYVYLAATRLSLYRSETDWALVIEVFGFSPRVGDPDTHIYTFASRLNRQNTASDYVSREAYENYLRSHPNSESVFVYPIETDEWKNPDDDEVVASGTHTIVVGGKTLNTPTPDAYDSYGIALEDASEIRTYEFCRALAEIARNEVLATTEQRRMCVPAELQQILQLEEWNHPNVVDVERPSTSTTFQQLAEVLVTGNVSLYKPLDPPNTHWENWPEGGTL